MRKAVVILGFGLVAALSLSACAVPVTVAAASYAMSGFTLIDQGKTVSDIALSAALDQDCALWRIIQDQPICVDALEEGDVYSAADENALTQLAEVTGKAPKSSTPD